MAEPAFSCSTCLAFAPDADRTVGGKVWGQCRRQSPAPLPSGVRAKWPDVRPDDWCCEFVAAGTPIEAVVNRGDAT